MMMVMNATIKENKAVNRIFSFLLFFFSSSVSSFLLLISMGLSNFFNTFEESPIFRLELVCSGFL
jgi:hypothetical protein